MAGNNGPQGVVFLMNLGTLMMSTVPPGEIKSTNFKGISIYPHFKFTIELPGTGGLPFLDTLTKPTPNSIASTVYRKPTHTDRSLDYNSNHPISAKLSVIHTLIHRSKQVCSTLNFSQRKWITFTES